MKTSKTRIFPPPYVECDKGHGRIEKRSIQASNALNEYLEPLFPYVGQVFRITRITTDLKGNNFQKQVHYGITSLTATQADLKRLLSLSRNHWHIENKIHYVRDFTYDEDRSQVRTGSGPRVMASLLRRRNQHLAPVGLLQHRQGYSRMQPESGPSFRVDRCLRKVYLKI